jgi:hypothetical protein
MNWPEFSVKTDCIPNSCFYFKVVGNVILCNIPSNFFSVVDMQNLAKIMYAMQKHCNDSVTVDIVDWLVDMLQKNGRNPILENRTIVVNEFCWFFSLAEYM